MPLSPDEMKRIKDIQRDCESFINEGRRNKAAINKAIEERFKQYQMWRKEHGLAPL